LLRIVSADSKPGELFFGILEAPLAYEPPWAYKSARKLKGGVISLSGPASAAMKRGTGQIHCNM
jgi:hypothetical protein